MYSSLQVQAAIGARKAVAFDLTAACSGFVVGLVTAAQFIRTGTYKNVLVIGADALSRYTDWRDRGALTTQRPYSEAQHMLYHHCQSIAHGSAQTMQAQNAMYRKLGENSKDLLTKAILNICSYMHLVWRCLWSSSHDLTIRKL